MSRPLCALAIAALACLAGGSEAQSASTPTIPAIASQAVGIWINPRGSVKVQTGACAGSAAGDLCGWVVWASPQAETDARDSGVSQLMGTELLRGYRTVGHGLYRGQVYVPDMGRTFYSTIEQRGANDLKISGCILGGLLCKSQDWHRA
jgi:uncharacterized protein (DUF2147 family)